MYPPGDHESGFRGFPVRCLGRDEGWLDTHDRPWRNTTRQNQSLRKMFEDALRMSRAESEFGHAFWEARLRQSCSGT